MTKKEMVAEMLGKCTKNINTEKNVSYCATKNDRQRIEELYAFWTNSKKEPNDSYFLYKLMVMPFL